MERRKTLATIASVIVPLAIALIPKLLPDRGQALASPVMVEAPQPVTASPPAPVPAPALSPSPAAPLGAVPALAPPPPAPTVAAPADCLQRFQQIGLPYQRGDDAAANETLVCRRGYALGYDATTHDPAWVMEHLTADDLKGSASRSDKFKQDPLLGAHDANNADYAKSGFDRGHQAPAGDAKFDQAVMDQSFFYSNMAPQVGIGFNRGAWKYLEETVRAWLLCGGHKQLYVITGPMQAGAAHAAIGADRVKVPSAFFKIVYDPDSNRAIGFVLPNRKIGSTIADLQTYVQPIAAIETDTGLAFFRTLDRRTQRLLKNQAATAWGHDAACSGGGGS